MDHIQHPRHEILRQGSQLVSLTSHNNVSSQIFQLKMSLLAAFLPRILVGIELEELANTTASLTFSKFQFRGKKSTHSLFFLLYNEAISARMWKIIYPHSIVHCLAFWAHC